MCITGKLLFKAYYAYLNCTRPTKVGDSHATFTVHESYGSSVPIWIRPVFEIMMSCDMLNRYKLIVKRRCGDYDLTIRPLQVLHVGKPSCRRVEREAHLSGKDAYASTSSCQNLDQFSSSIWPEIAYLQKVLQQQELSRQVHFGKNLKGSSPMAFHTSRIPGHSGSIEPNPYRQRRGKLDIETRLLVLFDLQLRAMSERFSSSTCSLHWPLQ